MFGMTTALRIYADASKEPETILLGGTTTEQVAEIREAVGGHFDAIRRGASDESGKHKPFVMVGYVHDEGRILNLPLNPVASMLFEESLFGDVLLVNGTNPETGDYDGETHSLPVAFCEYIIKGMYPAVQQSVHFSKLLATAVAYAKQSGTLTEDEYNKIYSFMSAKYEDAEKGGAPAESVESLPQEIRELMAKCVADLITHLGDDPKGGE